MSQLTPAGYDRLDFETGRLAETDRERELSVFRPGDYNLMMFNTTAMTRMTQERQRQAQLRQSSKESKPGASLITSKEQPKRKRIYGMGGSQGNEKSGTVKKPKLGGE